MLRLIIPIISRDIAIVGLRRNVGRLRRAHILSAIPILAAVLLERAVSLLLACVPGRIGLGHARRLVVEVIIFIFNNDIIVRSLRLRRPHILSLMPILAAVLDGILPGLLARVITLVMLAPA